MKAMLSADAFSTWRVRRSALAFDSCAAALCRVHHHGAAPGCELVFARGLQSQGVSSCTLYMPEIMHDAAMLRFSVGTPI